MQRLSMYLAPNIKSHTSHSTDFLCVHGVRTSCMLQLQEEAQQGWPR